MHSFFLCEPSSPCQCQSSPRSAPASRSFHPQDPGTSQSVLSEPPSLRDLSSFRDGRVLILMPATWNRLIKSSQQALRPLGPKSQIPRSGGLLSSSTLLFSHLSRASILQSWDLMGQVRLVPASSAVSRFGCVCGWRLANCGSSSQQAIVNRASRHLKKAVMSI